MDIFTCYCTEILNISRGDNLFTIMTEETVSKVASQALEPDSMQYFLDIYRLIKAGSQEAIFCPFCQGLSILKPRGKHFMSEYRLPEKNYPAFTLSPPGQGHDFICTCENHVDTSNLGNQWSLVPENETEQDHILIALDDGFGVKGFYEALYKVWKRMITCPHCAGATVITCDSQGNGLSATYYAKKDAVIDTESDADEWEYL